MDGAAMKTSWLELLRNEEAGPRKEPGDVRDLGGVGARMLRLARLAAAVHRAQLEDEAAAAVSAAEDAGDAGEEANGLAFEPDEAELVGAGPARCPAAASHGDHR